MLLYRRLWLALCGPVVLACAVLGLTAVRSSVLLPGALAFATSAGVLVLAFGGAGPHRWRWRLGVPAVAALSWAAAAGGHAVLGSAFGPVLLLLGMSVLPFGWQVLRRVDITGGLLGGPQTAAGISLPRGAVEAMDLRALCEQWRSSAAALRRARSLSEQDQLIRLRERYLDELERRDPAGFHRWLQAGPFHTGNPERFLGAAG